MVCRTAWPPATRLPDMLMNTRRRVTAARLLGVEGGETIAVTSVKVTPLCFEGWRRVHAKWYYWIMSWRIIDKLENKPQMHFSTLTILFKILPVKCRKLQPNRWPGYCLNKVTICILIRGRGGDIFFDTESGRNSGPCQNTVQWVKRGFFPCGLGPRRLKLKSPFIYCWSLRMKRITNLPK